MSHAVVRGKPTAAQLYLDTVLDAILVEQGLEISPTNRENVTLSQVVFHSMKERPQEELMINGATGETITIEQILKHAVSVARALIAKGARGKHAMLIMRNHPDMIVVYCAVIFAGMIPFMMDPNFTIYELIHFLKLIEPNYVFLDREFEDDFQVALKSGESLDPLILVDNDPEAMKRFTEGYSDDFKNFQVSTVSIDDPVMLLPTSGSTGIPKAAILTHRGLMTQLSSPWYYHTQFPKPTRRMMVLTTIQWISFTMSVPSCVVYQVPLILSPKPMTAEHVIEMLEKYRPTFTALAPAFAVSVVSLIRPDQMSSLETLFLIGAPSTPELMSAFIDKLPKTAQLCNGYGMTETHGFIATPDKHAPLKSNGRVFNFLYYKVIDDQGEQVGPGQRGELCVKGVNVIKGYHKYDLSNDESFAIDGWLHTGDVFHLDEDERLTFIIRKKSSFKFMGRQVAPEEVERVISRVPGVHESVVCATEGGPAAAVVLEPTVEVTREEIHKAVDSTLSEHKRLHGGIAFVPSIPHTHSGKLKRAECSKLIENLLKSGQCY